MDILQLDKLKGGIPGISSTYGAFLAEATVVCLSIAGHKPGVRIKVEGDFKAEFELMWQQEIGAAERSSWKDLKEATEYAAMGIAILLISELTNYNVFQRNDQGGEADFILLELNKINVSLLDLTHNAHLEVSGILTESLGNSLNMRIAAKRKNIENRTKPSQPVFIAVVEFGIPKAKIIEL